MNVLRLLLLCVFPLTAWSSEPLSDVYERVYPSVVMVQTSETIVPEFPGAQATSVEGVGSGFIVNGKGQIMTAAHVVQAADTVMVHFHDGAPVPADVISSDPATDLALLQLHAMPPYAKPAKLGDSDATRVGDEVFVVGAPLGAAYTLTAGRLSAKRLSPRMSGTGNWELMQTDASINQGNSGGPLFNRDGEVIGVVSHILSQSGASAGLGFAVSINMASRIMLGEGTFWSGMQGRQVDGLLASALQIPEPTAILVEQVAKGSPSEKIGLQGGLVYAIIGEAKILLGGDVLLKVNGIPVGLPGSGDRIRELLRTLKPKEELTLEILRGGRRKVLSKPMRELRRDGALAK